MSRWPTRWLFASWVGYWVLLFGVKLGPAIAAIWRATHGPSGQSNVSANFGNGVLSLVVAQSGRTTWSGSIHLLALAAWIAVPPLLLWLIWATRRPRVESSERVGG